MYRHAQRIQELRQRRKLRVRKTLRGSSSIPRLCVVKSNAHLTAQLIDDENHRTIGHVSTFSKEFKGTEFGRKNRASAQKLGAKMAEIARENNIKQVKFDRGAAKYHGVLAAFADAAREGGLEF